MNRTFRAWVLFPTLIVISVPVVVLMGLPWPWALRWVNPQTTAFMMYREREARRQGQELQVVHGWVPLEEMPGDLVRAVLVSEDDRFREHRGVDWKALAEEVHWTGDADFSWWDAADRSALRDALVYYREHRADIKGRSTLTQQLAKNLFFTPDRSLVRKAGEFVVAARLERFLGKDRILEIYLNTVELGPGIFGMDAGARAYFGVPVQRLNRVQAASLAATLPHPLTSNPATRPGRMAWRRDLILARLAGGAVVIPPAPDPAGLPAVELPPPPVVDTPGSPEPDTVGVTQDVTIPDTLTVREPPSGPGVTEREA